MNQVRLSQIESPAAFAAALEAHRAALADHRIGEPDIPAPIAHELLDQLILRVPESGPVETRGPDRFEIAPYEIVDDRPPPPTLTVRKQALLSELNSAAQAARAKVLSPARAHLLSLEYAAAGVKSKSKRAAGDRDAIKKFEAYSQRTAGINQAVAAAAVAIEELTEKTINNWTVPALD